MMPRGVFVRRLADHPAPTPQATPCRIWQGALDGDGYGARTNGQRIHRWVMEQVVGRPLAASEIVMHLCDNRPCFRFDHLRLGTLTDNHVDMMEKGRHGYGELLGAAHPNAKLTAEQVSQIKSGTVVLTLKRGES